MKSVYWRPQKISRNRLLLVAGISMMGLLLVKQLPVAESPTLIHVRWDAVHLTQVMFDVIREERITRGLRFNDRLDPTHSGLIGQSQSVVTSRLGDLRSKQTTVNPNFSAAVVQMLWDAGVRSGDTVAVGWSGSFPAWNIAVAAAIETLELNPIIVASATSSQYGANHPDFMWLDMESALRQRGLMSCTSLGVSMGAGGDSGLGISPEGRDRVTQAAQRNLIPELKSHSLQDSVEQRLSIYQQQTNGKSVSAYINVGGGVASTGGELMEAAFQPGLNVALHDDSVQRDCVMSRMIEAGVPVLHLRNAHQLAKQWRLPTAPTERPVVGEGRAFEAASPNRWLALSVILVVLVTLQVVVLQPGGHELLAAIKSRLPWRRRSPSTEPCSAHEPQLMV